jgi:hypothetical protein
MFSHRSRPTLSGASHSHAARTFHAQIFPQDPLFWEKMLQTRKRAGLDSLEKIVADLTQGSALVSLAARTVCFESLAGHAELVRVCWSLVFGIHISS